MFAQTKNLALAATVSLIALASAGVAKEVPEISEINVSASYDAAQDTNASELFPEITSDIQLALARLIPLSDNAADPTVRVDIRKIALNGDTMLPDSTEFNELEGVVSFQTNTGEGGQSFPVNITAVMDETQVPEGYDVVPPSLDDFYRAMVDGFALKIAQRIGTVNEEGAPISN
ncbi:MAG: hypothetical protein HKN30_17855 [Sulfitobacter sp.]|nr:hypothetical protein [Sulfitobacter sp.]